MISERNINECGITRIYLFKKNENLNIHTISSEFHCETDYDDTNHENASNIIGFQSLIWNIFKRTFLPVGYPSSVRSEYLTYQFWDSIQGISSYLRGVLTSRSVLAGSGVGSATASAVSAALLWALKDGMGMLSSLTFAYFYSDAFEVYFKEWRLCADVLNNVGLTLDLLSSLFPQYFVVIVSLSAVCHSCCGLIAGSTKARISSHFAFKGHLVDVTAKESTQETAVALTGLILGAALTSLIGNDAVSTWIVFSTLLTIHIFANYNLVRCLVIDVLNPQRAYLIVTNIDIDMIESPLTPHRVAQSETILRPIELTFFGPRLGSSVKVVLETLAQSDTSLASLIGVWNPSSAATREFIIGVDYNGRAVVCLFENSSEETEIRAYFIALYLQYCVWSDRPSDEVFNFTLRYRSIVSSEAKDSMKWYAEKIEGKLIEWGWDMSPNKTRFGGGSMRIVSDIIHASKAD